MHPSSFPLAGASLPSTSRSEAPAESSSPPRRIRGSWTAPTQGHSPSPACQPMGSFQDGALASDYCASFRVSMRSSHGPKCAAGTAPRPEAGPLPFPPSCRPRDRHERTVFFSENNASPKRLPPLAKREAKLRRRGRLNGVLLLHRDDYPERIRLAGHADLHLADPAALAPTPSRRTAAWRSVFHRHALRARASQPPPTSVRPCTTVSRRPGVRASFRRMGLARRS